MAIPFTPPELMLVADIGGTHARFALAEGGQLSAEATLEVAGYAGPLPAIRAYLARLPAPPTLAGAVLAVAGPVDCTAAQLTNGDWRFARAELAEELRLPPARVRLLNDFAALAWALPALSADALRQVGGGQPVAGAPRVVLGPGTGLGVAGLVGCGSGWAVVAGEGGHATLAPADERESAILALARRRFAHVSAERLLSGSGLPLLHLLAAEVDGRAVAPAGAPELVAAALAGERDAVLTLDTFCGWLGSFAGSVALNFGAAGGVYLGGGIVPRLGTRFDRTPFRARFEAKGRFADYLAALPVHVILTPAPALRGAAMAAAQQRREDE